MTPRTSPIALVPLILVAACQDYVFEPVVPALISVNNKVTEIEDTTIADILFVIDDSLSMAGEQQNLADNFDTFINAIEAANAQRRAEGKKELSYRLAVVSTSVEELRPPRTGGGGFVNYTTYAQNLTNPACETAYDFLADDPYPSGMLLAAPGNPDIIESDSFATSAEIVEAFKQNALLGVCGSPKEQGLRGMKLALEANKDRFLRPGSRLVIAFLSDEEDCSDPDADVAVGTPSDECVAEAALPDGGRLGPVREYADFLLGLGNSVTVGAIVSVTGDPPTPGICDDPTCAASCDCSVLPTQQQRDTCEADAAKRGLPCWCGAQSAGSRYAELARLVDPGGSLLDSICQQSFATTLEALADRIVLPNVLFLDARPHNGDPSLVLLKIIRDGGETILCNSPDAGQTCADGVDWAYQDSPPAIEICPSSRCVLQPGDSYKISFVERACSPDNPC